MSDFKLNSWEIGILREMISKYEKDQSRTFDASGYYVDHQGRVWSDLVHRDKKVTGLAAADEELKMKTPISREAKTECITPRSSFPTWKPNIPQKDARVRKSLTIHDDMTKEEAFREVNKFFGKEEDENWFPLLSKTKEIDWERGYRLAHIADAEGEEWMEDEEAIIKWLENNGHEEFEGHYWVEEVDIFKKQVESQNATN